jgi:hypothetical protein
MRGAIEPIEEPLAVDIRIAERKTKVPINSTAYLSIIILYILIKNICKY